MSSPVAKSVECSCEEIVKQTPNQTPIFAIFVEYSGEKNIVDVIIYDSTVGSHRISNEVRRNKFSALAAHLLTSQRELSFIKKCFFPFSTF